MPRTPTRSSAPVNPASVLRNAFSPAAPSVADALAAGATPSRLRALDLARPFHGARQRKVVEAHDASPEAVLLRLIAQYACRMTGHEFFSHTAAAVLWGLPLPIASLRAGSLDVSVFAPRRAPAAAGVSGHSVTPGLAHVVTHPARGVRVSTPASTVALLAGRVPQPTISSHWRMPRCASRSTAGIRPRSRRSGV